MNNFLYLNENDFFIGKGVRGPIACCNVPGIVFVMFMADPNVCKYCELAKPEFMQLPKIIQGAKFAACNLSRCKNLMEHSKQTTTPLTSVPGFILFVNNKPWIQYDGPRTARDFAQFLKDAIHKLQTRQTEGGQPIAQPTATDEKTAYGIAYDYDVISVSDPGLQGTLTCNEEGVCYLTNAETKPTSGIPQHQQPPPQQHNPYGQPQQGQYNPHQAAMAQQMKMQQMPQYTQQMQQMQPMPPQYMPQQQQQYYQQPMYQPQQWR